MAEIARFLGMVVRIFAEPDSVHYRPNFHVWYQDWSAVIAIDTIELVGGGIPRSQILLVEA